MSGSNTSAAPQGATFFVTGGSGFLGRQLISDLRAHGYSVRALARSDRAASTVRALGADVVPGDLSDIDSMEAGMKGCTVAIHCAAHVALWGPWEDFVRDTIRGTDNVLIAARRAGVKRFVHVSTEAVLADGKAIINADELRPLPAHPNGPYPKSKGEAERRVLSSNRSEMSTVVVRPRFVWGKGDTTLLPQLIDAMKKGQWMWFGGGKHRMSTCHVRNVSHGTLLAAQAGRGGEIYFLTDGDPVIFRDFISRMVKSRNVAPTDRSAPMWVADLSAAASEMAWRLFRLPGSPPLTRTAVNLMFREVTVSDRKARADIGYAPVVSIDAGLAELQE